MSNDNGVRINKKDLFNFEQPSESDSAATKPTHLIGRPPKTSPEGLSSRAGVLPPLAPPTEHHHHPVPPGSGGRKSVSPAASDSMIGTPPTHSLNNSTQLNISALQTPKAPGSSSGTPYVSPAKGGELSTPIGGHTKLSSAAMNNNSNNSKESPNNSISIALSSLAAHPSPSQDGRRSVGTASSLPPLSPQLPGGKGGANGSVTNCSFGTPHNPSLIGLAGAGGRCLTPIGGANASIVSLPDAHGSTASRKMRSVSQNGGGQGTPMQGSLGRSSTPINNRQATPLVPPSPMAFAIAPPKMKDIPAEPQTENTKGEHITPEQAQKTRYVLYLLIGLKLLTSYDSGAFSVVLGADNGLAQDLGISIAQGGTLGSAVFLGNLVGCIIAGNMFSAYPAKIVLMIGMMAHGLFTFFFGLSWSFEYALAVRFLIGITLAFPVVFSPIWVDNFGPSDRATTWMALMNAGVPIGIMLGFVIGGLVPAHTDLDWRWIFYTKAVAMAPVIFIIHRMDSAFLDVDGASSSNNNSPTNTAGAVTAASGVDNNNKMTPTVSASTEGSPTSPGTPSSGFMGKRSEGFRASIIRLLALLSRFAKNPLYISNVMALCALYFVITALQTFITQYLKDPPFNASMNTIVVGFGGTVVTAPVVGVIGGGVLIDRLGGYQENTAQAMQMQATWGLCCFVLSCFTIMATNTWSFLISMWLLLAVGGAIVPVATGVLVASVAEEDRPAASSVSALCFNLFGYFSGPLFCGFVADFSGSLTWGIRITLLSSILGVFPSAYAAYVAKRIKLPTSTPSISENDTGSGSAVDPLDYELSDRGETASDLGGTRSGTPNNLASTPPPLNLEA